MNILLIAGHGNGDSGAIGNGYRESDLTREFAKKVYNALKKICDVNLANTNLNWFEYLDNSSFDFSKYDYILEIHFNAGGGTGSEIYVTTSEYGISVEHAILEHLCSSSGYTNRGVKRKNFRVISSAKKQGVSSALLEVCFIDSTSDMTIYQNQKDLLANAVARGIAQGFGLISTPCAENTLNIPDWAANAVEWCSSNGILPKCNKNLSEDNLWTCVAIYNAVKFMSK